MTDEAGKQRVAEIEADLKNITVDIQVAREFLGLIHILEKLSGMQDPRYDKERGCYSAVSSGRPISELELFLENFFGPPKKRFSDPMPAQLQNHPVLGYLEGTLDRQSLFFKKSESGLFFSALEPLEEPYGAVTVRLGFARKKSARKPAAAGALEMEDIGLPTKSMEERIAEELGVGSGLVNGVGLATFLLEAEIEQSSCSLRVVCGQQKGYLFVREGVLIDASAGEMRGREAAVEVLSWTDTEIALEAAVEREEDVVGQPLVRTLAAALKKRKTEKGPSAEKAPVDAASPPAGKKAGKKNKGRRKRRVRPLSLAAAAAVLILAAAAVFGFHHWKESQREKAFTAATAAAEAQSDTDKAVAVLEQFVEAGPDDAYSRKAEDRIQQLKAGAEQRFLDRLTAEVAALPVGPAFEREAEQILRRYLERYPNGRFVDTVESRIQSLPREKEERLFLQVTESGSLEPEAKMAAYREYIENAPDGARRGVVEKRMEALVAAKLRDLEMEVDRCRIEGESARCFGLIDDFMSVFATPESTRTVSGWRRQLQARQDKADLEKRTAGLERDPEALRRALQAFIQERPDSPVAEEARSRLAAVDGQMADRLEWEKVAAAARDERRSLDDRIGMIEAYLAGAEDEDYRRSAYSLKTELEREYRRQMAQRRAEQSERIRQARLEQQQQQQEWNRRRLSKISRQVASKLAVVGERFAARGDGTFTDTRTGLVWTLLDSRRVLDRCHDYETALRYVAGLTTGNHRDWRLPTAAELAGLYKNRPFFPDGDVPWYWTSRRFVTGYHEKVRVVTPDGSGELQPEYRRSTECGAVRAVRNPG